MDTKNTENSIAIIGWAGRFPGAQSIEAFWRNLGGGVESLEVFDEASIRKVSPKAFYEAPDFVGKGFELKDVDLFDADFFGINSNDAKMMDPQHRIFLECCWQAMEDAGYDVDRIDVPVGVYASAGLSTNLMVLLPKLLLDGAPFEAFQSVLYNDKDWVAPLVSYKLGLTGPSMGIQSGCSSALVAVHQACQSLLIGETGMALAGAVSIRGNQKSGYREGGAGLWSPDGRVRPYDAQGEGTVFSNGVGVLLLKRLEDALAHGDHIHAVIAGSAVNNDGRAKQSFAAPSVDGQRRVIEDAMELAELSPEDIGYIEGHGTGTPVGDVVEVAALNQVFGKCRSASGAAVRLGSVKGNIGHMECASGVAGLIKAALSVKHGRLVPTVNHARASEAIDWRAGPLRVSTECEPWPSSGGAPRRAGVSSFGAGGTNAHIVVEEPPAREREARPEAVEVLMLSARTPGDLRRMAQNLSEYCRSPQAAPLGDVAHTLRVGRQRMPYRASVAARSSREAAERLAEVDEARATRQAPGERGCAFVFPGAGPQAPGMSGRLYETEPVFRDELESCLGELPEVEAEELRRLLIGPARGDDAALLARPSFAMPALFVHCAALFRLLGHWGVQPTAVMGHSFGEYVAAWAAGVFSRKDALQVARLRGALLERCPPGSMLGVRRGAGEVKQRLAPDLSIAAVNAPDLCVVSGPSESIASFAEAFPEDDVFRVQIATAGHSSLVEAVVPELERLLRGVTLREPHTSIISNTTGGVLPPKLATNPSYWARHLREPVLFAEGLRTLMASECRLVVEVGPGTSMTALVGANRSANGWTGHAVATMRHAKEELDDQLVFHRAIGELWSKGAPVDEARFDGEGARRASLPTYPFDRKRWVLDLDLASALVSLESGRRAPAEDAPTPAAPRPASGASALEGEAGRDPIVAEFTRILGVPYSSMAGEERWGASFFELGGNSLLAAQLLGRLRDQLGIQLRLREFLATPTIRGLRALADGARVHPAPAGRSAPVQGRASRWITELAKNPAARWRLVCFHHAGGQAEFFRTWRAALPASVDLWAVTLPGRGGRIAESLVDHLDGVVPSLALELEGLMDRPTALFGHSMGALVAFATAQRLERQGRASDALFLSAFRPPHLPSPRPKPLHLMDDEGLIEELRELGGTPAEILEDAGWRDIVLRTFRADMKLCEVFDVEPSPVAAPIFACGGSGDSVASPAVLEEWARYTRRGFARHTFPGGHFYLEEPDTRRRLIETILGAVRGIVRKPASNGVEVSA